MKWIIPSKQAGMNLLRNRVTKKPCKRVAFWKKPYLCGVIIT